MLILTNDDGIDAPGLQTLIQAVNKHDSIHPPLIVAPQKEWSGCGHQVTTQHPIQISHRSSHASAITGTPADCVRIALHHFLGISTQHSQLSQSHWVISGVNYGGNLGADIYISGTVAAAREAAFHGIPSMAISQYRKGNQPINWEYTQLLTQQVLTELLRQPPQLGSFWNVNLPYLTPNDPKPTIIFCQPCPCPLPVAYHQEGDSFSYIGDYGKRDRTPGSDVEVCFSGQIAVSQIFI